LLAKTIEMAPWTEDYLESTEHSSSSHDTNPGK